MPGADLALRRPTPGVLALVPAVGLLAAALIYGHVRTSGEYTTEPRLRVALVQGNVMPEVQPTLDSVDAGVEHYRLLSHKGLGDERRAAGLQPSAGSPVDLIVWPESMLGLVYDCHPSLTVPDDWPADDGRRELTQACRKSRKSLADKAQELGTPILGGVCREYYGVQRRHCFNSAVFVSADGKQLDYYDKMHLVMFGEYMPFADQISWLQYLTPVTGSATPGQEPAAFRLRDVWVAPNICYETVLAHVIRRQVNELRDQGREPDVLVNVTNDSWFQGSNELEMHLACSVFRAVECRKPLLIAANTGISAWIDGDGWIRRRGPQKKTDFIVADVWLDQRESWYLRHGDWPAGTCLAACVLLAIVGIVGWLRRFKSLRNRDSVG